ncbi:MAG: hypothetical protein HOE76_01775 [Euryarchaeota archaeon]|jgi:hypothetical protein|nr:hypothetical protein [Euryarchaeota archaeon]MBT4981572.1 hypothetical protein [Euryarchaeota archaeon]MBT5183655.1 hypothetical protein [Euryarchaeota archaeon]
MKRVFLYALTIGIGLFVSAKYGEWPVNIGCIGLFMYLFSQAERRERIEMITVLAFATPMELFFSEVWLIYEYQRGLMPLFVPVGHWFLFDAGRRIATHLPVKKAMFSLIPFIPLVAYGVWTGGDTSGLFLLILVLAFTKWGPQPSLYATMAWAALLMELWGTYLANWTWSNEVPWTGLTAWNPPLLVGAFYCLGDVLVNLSVAKFEGEHPLEVTE